MFDDDFSGFTGPGADLNHDGKVDFAEYDNDCHDFNSIYGNKQSGGKVPKTTGGFWNWFKWQGCSTWIIGLLIALSIPAPIGPVLLVIIGIAFVIMLITA